MQFLQNQFISFYNFFQLKFAYATIMKNMTIYKYSKKREPIMLSNFSKNFEFENFDIDTFDFSKKRLNFFHYNKNYIFEITKKQSYENIFHIDRKIFLILQKVKKSEIVKNFSSRNFNFINRIFSKKKGKE